MHKRFMQISNQAQIFRRSDSRQTQYRVIFEEDHLTLLFNMIRVCLCAFDNNFYL